jgi:2-aminoadipate transaminase
LERRKQLIEIADHYGVPIIEDDPYGQLRYEGENLPSIVNLDNEFRKNGTNEYGGNVIYLSTFSKTLAPGLRLAWVIAPKQVIRKLVQAKQGADLHTATFNQIVAYEVARGGFMDRHIWLIRRIYGERRNIMLDAMEELFPPGVTWTKPKGGLFLWGMLPMGMDSTQILKVAVKRNVAFVPGTSFFALGGGENTMRLNFSYSNPDQIQTGIERLANVLKETIIAKK